MWGPLLPYLKETGAYTIGLDIDPLAWGLYDVDEGILVPKYDHPDVWNQLLDICKQREIDWVLPSINEGLIGWAEHREELAQLGCNLIQSPLTTVKTFSDKWETYQYFLEHYIPTPATSLEADYDLLKPRSGRGAAGIRRIKQGETVDMTGYVSQECLEGQEYSIDTLVDTDGEPLCVVIRERVVVESGLSIKGRVIKDDEIEAFVRKIVGATPCFGPIDIQCFRTAEGIKFIEVNPRIAGGLSLSIAATTNWFKVIEEMLGGH